MDPVVSVIIPNYNHAPFLKQRIDSVLSQTFQDFEVIVLDDFSTDKSRDIIESYRSNPKIKDIIYNNTNSGSPFKQWQKGIGLANGKYIWIAESDDFCDQIFLQSAVEALEGGKHSVHYCQSYNVDENGNIINDNFCWTESISGIDWRRRFHMNGKEFIKRALKLQNVLPNASAVVFEKKEFNFSRLDKYKTAGDWLFWIRILLTSDISYSSEILNNFRSHSSTTRSVTTHPKFILRHFEVLSIKHDLCYKYELGSKTEVDDFLKICIDICSMDDIISFSKFCNRFELPKEFIAKFFVRKFAAKSSSIIARGKNLLRAS